MGKKTNVRNSRKKKKAAWSTAPRNVVNIEKVLGGANFGGGHGEEPAHLRTSIRPAQIPLRDPEFTGREQEIIELSKGLLQGGAIAISGKPGVGKTALAVHLAHKFLPRYPDAQLYVDLSNVGNEEADIDRVLESLLRALGFTGDEIAQDIKDKVSQYRSALFGLRCIVVLDNVANEGQARYLLPGNQEGATIITSGRNLGGLVGVRRHRIERLAIVDCVNMLRSILGDDRVAAEHGQAEKIAELCGGLPLALRISANRLRDRPHWPLQYYAERLLDERRRLEYLQSGDLEVRSTFSLAYAVLSENEKAIFRRLGVIPSQGFEAPLIAALSGIEVDDAESLLDRLLEANLVELTTTPGRYQIHNLIRVFARERLEEVEAAEEVTRLIDALIEWFSFLSYCANRRIFSGGGTSQNNVFDSPESATDWLENEHQALVYVIDLAYEREMHLQVLRTAFALSRFFERRLHGNSWRKVTGRALSSARAINDKSMLVKAIIERVRMGEKFPHHGDSVVALLDEAHKLTYDLRSTSFEAKVLYSLGRLTRRKGKNAEAGALFSRSAELAARSKDYHQQGNSLLALAETHLAHGEHKKAEASANNARLLFLSRHDRHCQGNALSFLGRVRTRLRDFEGAEQLFRQAIRNYRAVHDLHCAGMTSSEAGRAYRSSGDSSSARRMWRQAKSWFEEINDTACLQGVISDLATLDYDTEDYDQAVLQYKYSCQLLKESGSRRAYAHELMLLGKAVEKSSGYKAAVPYWEEALTMANGDTEGLADKILDILASRSSSRERPPSIG